MSISKPVTFLHLTTDSKFTIIYQRLSKQATAKTYTLISILHARVSVIIQLRGIKWII